MDFIREFMRDRHGFDKFGWFLLALSIALSFLAHFVFYHILNLLSLAVFVYFLFRVLSKKEYARQRENRWFLDLSDNLKDYYYRMKSGERLYLCPVCKHKFNLSDSNNKYSTKIKCPKCGNEF